MNLRPKLSYANVVATLALILVVGGGTVYAANKLGKNAVKSKNIAAGAVKAPDLAKNAVRGAKVKDGSLGAKDLAAGVFEGLDTDVTGTAQAGQQGGLDTDTTSPLPLSGKTTFTPGAGEVAALAAEGRFTIASTDPAKYCQPAVIVLVNGEPTRVFVSPSSDGNSTTPQTSIGRDADGPFGVLDPGTPLAITAELRGDVDCTAGSRLDELQIRVVQIR